MFLFIEQLCIGRLDGWGCSSQSNGNAVAAASTPTLDQLSANSVQLAAHGEHVGLAAGSMGNCEASHQNIGAGRVITQVAYEALVAGVDDDTLVFFNYRADRMRQLTACMGIQQNYLELDTNIALPCGLRIYTMTQYSEQVV
ncbi:hypothetical protein GPALN_010615 [Globodera pallida]|nr:hypothetical protein GPALN_010615 [Globodera pallida]